MAAPSFRRVLAALPLLALSMPLHAQDTPVATEGVQQQDVTGWGHPVYDIAPDAAVRFGMLENGLRYAILANDTPKDTASVRLGFDVGWIDERDDELGLAHMLEHMAFNGSRNVPEGEMVKLLERLGLAFGADTNASTGFEDTIYKLDLPRTDEKLVDTALMLMRETASELTIADDAVDRERGIIQSETRARNTFPIRRFKHYFQFVAPQTRYAQRFRADGTDAIIDTAPGQTLRDLYRRFYRPDNAVLVVVGALDPDTVEEKIRSRFSSWSAPSQPRTEIAKGTLDLQRGPDAANFVDPDVQYVVVIDRFAPYAIRRPNVADSEQSRLVALGTAILNRRLQRIANAEDAPIISGRASSSDFFDIQRSAQVQMQAREGEWERALEVGETEWRRAVEHGFTEAELAEQIANFEQRARDAASQQDTRRNRALADGLLGTARRERLFVTPQTGYELFLAHKPQITAAAVSQAFAEHFALSDPLIHVSTKEAIPEARETILTAWRAAAARPVEPPEDASGLAFAYADFGEPGTIAEDGRIEDLGIRTIRFSNNVRLNLKPTDFETGRLRFSIRVGSGLLALPDEAMAEGIFLSSVGALGGLGQHSYDELRQIFAGRRVRYGFAARGTSFGLRNSSTMADIALQMRVSAAYFSDPGLRAEMLTRWQAILPPYIAQLDATPQAVAGAEVARIVANGNPRFGIPSEEELGSVTLDSARAAIAEQFASAPIEIAVVGDFDSDAVIAAVAETFGALPDRAATLESWEEARVARFAESREERVLTHAGSPDQALAMTYWPTSDDDDAQEEATMQLLAIAMRLEMLQRIREELGASYSPGASSRMSDIYRDFGTFSTSVIVAPGEADTVFEVVEEIARDFRTQPIDQDLLDRARTPLLERVALNRRENSWWLSVLDEAQLRGERLDRVRSYEDRVRAVTPDMLQEAARRYLRPEEALRIRVLHESLAPTP
ncbi:M16 family metallopeptidase [Qipengyuania flava]|uniref:M16 family metallopeptidase n=1 Tax=Qipengyuania flava TaxID=192812 RepID=UPI001C633A60|nr:M16 family metallopeptidase [Qipengyuania flava]QYJ08159.1 insulinase family protein [Qipengyuania flava]